MTLYRRIRGFTLAEMAIVVVIAGILLSMGLKTWLSQLENAAYSDTKARQELIKAALISFMRTNGRLPCPDRAATPTGAEPASCPTSANGYGVVPWSTLGLPRDTALDGWNNFFTYRVSNVAGTANAAAPAVPRAKYSNQNWTVRTTGIASTAFDLLSLAPVLANGFTTIQIQQGDGITALSAASTLTYNAVAVIYSHGKNGFGATTTKGTVLPAPTAADELTNATAGSILFVVRPYTETTAAAGGAYDDVVAYITPQDLLQPLVTEGTLKSCKSYCAATSNNNGLANTCTGLHEPYAWCTGAGTPTMPLSACTAPNTPYTYCTAAGAPATPPVACTASAAPYSFCVNGGSPALPTQANPVCTAAATPYGFCTGAGTPAIPLTACTAAGAPYAFCTGAGTPTLPLTAGTCFAALTPVGNPTPINPCQ